jgi:hypothetical protein
MLTPEEKEFLIKLDSGNHYLLFLNESDIKEIDPILLQHNIRQGGLTVCPNHLRIRRKDSFKATSYWEENQFLSECGNFACLPIMDVERLLMLETFK